MTPALQQAYQRARYEILTRPPIVLRLGASAAPSAATAARQTRPIRALLGAHRADCAALITAANPRSVRLSDDQNRQRHANLAQWLLNAGLPCLPARSSDAQGDWVEDGFFIFGLHRARAVALARQFGQNALVWVAADGGGELLLLDDQPSAPV